MHTIETLSVKEVHQIAYLTMKGWTLDYGERWTKEGFKYKRRFAWDDEGEEVDYFDLEDAYDAQIRRDEQAAKQDE